MRACKGMKMITLLGRSFGHVHCSKVVSVTPALLTRRAHSQPITQNMQYISNNRLNLEIEKKTLKLQTSLERPLCLILSWLASKPRHLMKYADIYLEMGFDVMTVTCSPLQLMFPVRGAQVVAANLMKFLEHNEHRPLVVHGFSVGAYVWAELLVHALKDPERYQPVLDRVAAQLWDSPADVEELPVGLPISLYPNNKLMQKALKAYARTHLWMFYEVATKHYWRATQAFQEPPCRAPTLFLISKADPVGAVSRSRRAHASMTALGIKCNWQCWEDSPHVQHFYWYREEYLAALYSHLQECGLLRTHEASQTTGCRQ